MLRSVWMRLSISPTWGAWLTWLLAGCILVKFLKNRKVDEHECNVNFWLATFMADFSDMCVLACLIISLSRKKKWIDFTWFAAPYHHNIVSWDAWWLGPLLFVCSLKICFPVSYHVFTKKAGQQINEMKTVLAEDGHEKLFSKESDTKLSETRLTGHPIILPSRSILENQRVVPLMLGELLKSM